MKNNKHFRKDVIIARSIFAAACILIGVLLWFGVSVLLKPQGDYADPEGQKQESQHAGNQDVPVSENSEGESDARIESEDESDNSEPEDTVAYVMTNAEVRLRVEPNTNCEILARIASGTELVLLEELEGWYKVEFQGQVGYISAEFATVNR